MLFSMYTVYDNGTETYLPPFVQHNDKEAIRGFITVLNDPSTQYAKSPADYTLFCLGTYDQATAEFVIYEAKKNIGNGLHLKNYKESEPKPTRYQEKVAMNKIKKQLKGKK